MFVEEASWLARTLADLPLRRGDAVLDVGASTAAYRTGTQPHIARQIVDPLRERGLVYRTLDAKTGPGVDVVADLTAGREAVARAVGERFPLVLCTNVLTHVTDPHAAAAGLRELVAPGGYLVVTTPQSFRRTTDPLDNGLRPAPAELAALVRGGDPALQVVKSASLRIDSPAQYRSVLGRPSWQRLAGRWVPLPGAAEAVRRRVPAWRWRESCVVLRRG
jgi:SAM-dependent methyltransferase